MELLSEDDRNLAAMTRAELEAAWELWFDLAQHTNDFDEPYTHGVFVGMRREPPAASRVAEAPPPPGPPPSA